MGVTRRALLGLGGAGMIVAATAAGIEEDVLPGRASAYEHLGLNGSPGPTPTTAPGTLRSGEFISAKRGGESTGYTIAYPPGGQSEGLPVVIALHMLRRDHADLFGPRMALDRFLAEAVAAGVPPFAIAAPDGGNSYWHLRPGGVDAGAMVTDEFLPLLKSFGLDTRRIGLLGWSMGGYGALRLGGVLGPERVVAVSVAAPAIWTDPEDASTSGFASTEEYREYEVFGREKQLRDIPIRIDCGRGDPFYHSVKTYAEGLARSSEPGGAEKVSRFQLGGHNPDFWRKVIADQLAFVGKYLPRG